MTNLVLMKIKWSTVIAEGIPNVRNIACVFCSEYCLGSPSLMLYIIYGWERMTLMEETFE